jgi:TRAP-type C4-dicarboxylate transport system permease large subunit
LVGATIVAREVWEKISAAQRAQMLAAARKSGEVLKADVRSQDSAAVAAMMAGQPGKKANKLQVTHVDAVNGSGSLGLLFPPSLPVILYAVYAKTVQIDTLFVGGFVPGLLMVTMVAAWGVFNGVKSGAERSRFCFAEACQALWIGKWELALPAIVVVGLFGGFGTLVEAGAIAVVYSFVVECFILRKFSVRRDFPRCLQGCC